MNDKAKKFKLGLAMTAASVALLAGTPNNVQAQNQQQTQVTATVTPTPQPTNKKMENIIKEETKDIKDFTEALHNYKEAEKINDTKTMNKELKKMNKYSKKAQRQDEKLDKRIEKGKATVEQKSEEVIVENQKAVYARIINALESDKSQTPKSASFIEQLGDWGKGIPDYLYGVFEGDVFAKSVQSANDYASMYPENDTYQDYKNAWDSLFTEVTGKPYDEKAVQALGIKEKADKFVDDAVDWTAKKGGRLWAKFRDTLIENSIYTSEDENGNPTLHFYEDEQVMNEAREEAKEKAQKQYDKQAADERSKELQEAYDNDEIVVISNDDGTYTIINNTKKDADKGEEDDYPELG